MSEQEQDAVIGRLVREHAKDKRKLVAMTEELNSYEKAFKLLTSGLACNVVYNFNLTVVEREMHKEPLSKLDFNKLIEFLREYTELRSAVEAGAAKLHALNFPA